MTQQAPERIWANVSGNRQTYLTGQNINHTEPYIRADLSPSPEAFQQMREALEPFSKFAGEVFAKNFNNDHVVIAMSGHDGVVKLSDFFKARAALKAAEGES